MTNFLYSRSIWHVFFNNLLLQIPVIVIVFTDFRDVWYRVDEIHYTAVLSIMETVIGVFVAFRAERFGKAYEMYSRCYDSLLTASLELKKTKMPDKRDDMANQHAEARAQLDDLFAKDFSMRDIPQIVHSKLRAYPKKTQELAAECMRLAKSGDSVDLQVVIWMINFIVVCLSPGIQSSNDNAQFIVVSLMIGHILETMRYLHYKYSNPLLFAYKTFHTDKIHVTA